MMGDVRLPPNSAPLQFSLELSDLLSHETGTLCPSSGPLAASGPLGLISTTLQVFNLCGPQDGATVSRTDVMRVLQSHLGGQTDVDHVLMLDGGISRESIDFLTFWKIMDRCFYEAGTVSPITDDRVVGLQSFRDGVLNIYFERMALGGPDLISTTELRCLLSDIREIANDISYWDQIMTALPSEGGRSLSLPEIAEAVCVWLREVLESEAEASNDSLSVVEPSDSPRSPASQPHHTSSRAGVSGLSRASVILEEVLSLPENSTDLDRARELVDFVVKAVGPGNSSIQRTLARLAVVHDSLARGMNGHKARLGGLRSTIKQTEVRCDHMEQDMAKMSTLNEQFKSELVAEREAHNIKVRSLDQLEADLRVLKKQRTDASAAQRLLEDSEDKKASLLSENLELIQRCGAQSVELLRLQQDHQLLQRKCQDQEVGDGEVQAEETLEDVARKIEVASEFEERMLLQEAQLHNLRRLRDDLLAAHDGYGGNRRSSSRSREEAASKTSPSTEPRSDHSSDCRSRSPIDLQTRRHNRFLLLQLKALRRFLVEEESDSVAVVGEESRDRDRSDSVAARGEQRGVRERRLAPLEQFHQDATATFNEMSERLHTIEVQKSDVDHELRRLQLQLKEKDEDLRAVQKLRDQLLVTSKKFSLRTNEDASTQPPEGSAGRVSALGSWSSSLSMSDASPRPAADGLLYVGGVGGKKKANNHNADAGASWEEASEEEEEEDVGRRRRQRPSETKPPGIQLHFNRAGSALPSTVPSSGKKTATTPVTAPRPADNGFLSGASVPAAASQLSCSPLQFGVKRVVALHALTRHAALLQHQKKGTSLPPAPPLGGLTEEGAEEEDDGANASEQVSTLQRPERRRRTSQSRGFDAADAADPEHAAGSDNERLRRRDATTSGISRDERGAARLPREERSTTAARSLRDGKASKGASKSSRQPRDKASRSKEKAQEAGECYPQ